MTRIIKVGRTVRKVKPPASSAAVPGGTGSVLTTKGDIHTYTTADVRLAIGSSGQVLTAGTSGEVKWAGAVAGTTSPLTTKGDVWVYGSTDTRLAVGTNDQVLTADSAQATGLKWAAAGGADVPEWISYLKARQSDETSHTDDIFFSGSSSGTDLTVSGSVTWTEGRDRMSAVFDDQTSEDFACKLWAFTSASSPMTIETRCRVDGPAAALRIANLTISDGVVAGSNMVRAGFYLDTSNNRRHTLAEGTFTAHSSAAGDELMHDTAGGSWAYLQLIWTAANTFKSRWSIDGVTWYDPHGTISQTMTPTHYGLAVSTYGGASESFAAFDYVRVYDSDESA